MRVVWFLAWVLVVLVVLLPLLRRLTRARRAALPDELVKDPVCQTYVVRSRAVRGEGSGEPVYFCSAQCARRWPLPRQ
jgi:YHS domain-containing protein